VPVAAGRDPHRFLCRDVYEMRAKMKELRLTEQPGKRRVVL
jgi:hypothetical protein